MFYVYVNVSLYKHSKFLVKHTKIQRKLYIDFVEKASIKFKEGGVA